MRSTTPMSRPSTSRPAPSCRWSEVFSLLVFGEGNCIWHNRSAPSPLVGEGRGGGSGDVAQQVPHSTTPTPDPSPQGGGEKGRRTMVDWPSGAAPIALEHLMAQAPMPSAWPAVLADDIALLPYTGATTGTPKAAVLNHANLTADVS